MAAACALCGDYFEKQVPEEQWRKRGRAIYARYESIHNVRVTGIGKLRNDNKFHAPKKPEQRFGDAGVSPEDMIDVDPNVESMLRVSGRGEFVNANPRYDRAPYFGFPFHGPCWDLLSALVDPIEPVLGDLFQLCFSMRVDGDGILDWGHCYEDRTREKGPVTPGASLLSNLHLGRYWHAPIGDPFCVPVIQELMVALTDPTGNLPLITGGLNTERDKFRHLPRELLQEILVHLPSADVASLRLASPAFANEPLAEGFWASRFCRDREFHHVFEVSHMRPESWRAFYAVLQRVGWSNPSWNNRKRVWKLALNVQHMLKQIEGVPCKGDALSTYYFPGRSHNHRWHIAKCRISNDTSDFHQGCRPLRQRMMFLPSGSAIKDIWVSFAVMNGEKYICGLRVVSIFDNVDADTFSLGYIRPSTERRVRFPGYQHGDRKPYGISGFRLALDSYGFRAFAVVDDGDNQSLWVGDPTLLHRWDLHGPDQQILAVQAQFDALKMISFGRDVTSCTRTDQGILWRNKCSWYPNTPPGHALLVAEHDWLPVNHSTQPALAFSTIIFGGEYGQDLCQLTRIVVHMAQRAWGSGSVLGIEFRYADPSKNKHIGSLAPADVPDDDPTDMHPRAKRTMDIDGPGGELISGVEVCWIRGTSVFAALKIQTNFGREKALNVVPIEEEQREYIPMNTFGSIITGFFLIETKPMERLGVMSINPEYYDGPPMKGTYSSINEWPHEGETDLERMELEGMHLEQINLEQLERVGGAQDILML